MTVSHLSTSESGLISGVIAAFVVNGYPFNPLSTSVDEYLVGVLNDLTGQSFSHFRMSRDEVLARIAGDLTGTAYSHLSTSQDELLVLVLNNIEVGGDEVPEWVPENAKIHIDLVGGSPQGRAWVFGVGEVAVDTLLGTDANTENGWGASIYEPENLTVDGYISDGDGKPALIGSARSSMASGATLAITATDMATAINPFVALSVDGVTAIFVGQDAPDIDVGTNGADLALSIDGVVNYSADTFVKNTIALTYAGTRFEVAVNGSDVEAGTLTEIDVPPASPVVAYLFDVGNAALQSITLYDALPSTTGLSALSETGVINTAPHDVVSTWDFGGVEGEVPEDNVEAANALWSGVSATDDEGNPLTYSVTGDGRVTFDAGTILFDASGGLTAGDIDFTLRATDPGGLFVEQEFTITVTVAATVGQPIGLLLTLTKAA